MSHTQSRKKSSIKRLVLILFSLLLFVAGGFIVWMSLFEEQKTTELYGEIKLYTEEVIRENGGTPPGEVQDPITGLPVIRLEGSGGQRELDLCTGAFVHMATYEDSNNLPPVWSAHNGCGGDIILSWDIGSRFIADGQEYEIVDFRSVPQVGSKTDDIVGITGDLLLQSCTYDGVTMHFLGAEKVKTPEELEMERIAAEEAAEIEEGSASGALPSEAS